MYAPTKAKSRSVELFRHDGSMSILQERLKRLEVTHGRNKAVIQNLPVYYGWAKLNKIQKREALMVIFLNDQTGPRVGKDGQDGVTRFMVPVYKRWQTDEEKQDAKQSIRTYSAYSIFMDDKAVRGSLEAALEANFKADKNHVPEGERLKIKKLLRDNYLEEHSGYKEPLSRQLEFNFE